MKIIETDDQWVIVQNMDPLVRMYLEPEDIKALTANFGTKDAAAPNRISIKSTDEKTKS